MKTPTPTPAISQPRPAAKHTPGPWEVYPSKDRDGDSTLSIRGQAQFIATMDIQSINGGPFKLPPNGEANARLIASAPDLLWALHACLADLQDITSAEGGDESEAMKQARAAIAQAEGGAQ